MFRRITASTSTVIFGLLILSISLLRSASVNYAFSGPTPSGKAVIVSSQKAAVEYYFPYQGGVLPDHPLWFLKAVRDRVWFTLTTSSSKKAELALLFSDKRLLSSKILFERNKPELAFSTLSKGEKYLEEALALTKANRERGLDTASFDIRLAKAALKHREIIEGLIAIAPEDAKPGIIKILDYSKDVYKSSRDALRSKGLPAPESPFIGD